MVAGNSGSAYVVLRDEGRNNPTDHPHVVGKFPLLHADNLTHNEHRAFKTLHIYIDHERCALNATELTTAIDSALGADLATYLIVAHVTTAKRVGQRDAHDVFDPHDETATKMVIHVSTTCDANEDSLGQVCAVAEMVDASITEADQ